MCAANVLEVLGVASVVVVVAVASAASVFFCHSTYAVWRDVRRARTRVRSVTQTAYGPAPVSGGGGGGDGVDDDGGGARLLENVVEVVASQDVRLE